MLGVGFGIGTSIGLTLTAINQLINGQKNK